jgi:hypothetical protein
MVSSDTSYPAASQLGCEVTVDPLVDSNAKAVVASLAEQ